MLEYRLSDFLEFVHKTIEGGSPEELIISASRTLLDATSELTITEALTKKQVQTMLFSAAVLQMFSSSGVLDEPTLERVFYWNDAPEGAGWTEENIKSIQHLAKVNWDYILLGILQKTTIYPLFGYIGRITNFPVGQLARECFYEGERQEG